MTRKPHADPKTYFMGSYDPDRASFSKNVYGSCPDYPLEHACKFEVCTSSAVLRCRTKTVEQLAFNAQKYRGSHDPAGPIFRIFKGIMPGLSLGTLTPNLNSMSLTLLEQFAFNSMNGSAICAQAHKSNNKA